jgi:hypothetical protein
MKTNKLFDYFLSSLLPLAFLILIYTPWEFRITEIWMLTPKINQYVPTLSLIGLVFLFNLFNWEKILAKGKGMVFLIIFISGLSCFIYFDYRQNKLSLEYLPKIYKISSSWGIQGSIIKIEGVNFLPTWEKGKAFLDKEELHVRSWDEKSVVVEQPIMSRFGSFELYLIRNDGLQSNKFKFLVKDPKDLFL